MLNPQATVSSSSFSHNVGNSTPTKINSSSSSGFSKHASSEYYNRTLVVLGEHVFDPNQSFIEEFDLYIESKKAKKQLKYSKPQWSVTLETILDHCRMVNDIFPEEAGICVALQHHSSEIAVMNEWNWEQQSFLEISSNLATGIDQLHGTPLDIEKKTSPYPFPTIQQLERFCHNIFLQIFSQSDVKAREKSQHNVNSTFKVIYVTKCSLEQEEYIDLKTQLISNLAIVFEKQFEKFKSEVRQFMQHTPDTTSTFNVMEYQLKMQQFKLFSSFSEEDLDKLSCTLDIIIPIPKLKEFLQNVDEETTFICQSLDYHTSQFRINPAPFESVKIWDIERDSFDRILREKIAQKQYGLVVIAVQGIPMRDVSEGTSNYDVFLACKGITFDMIQDVNISSGVINLKWVRADPNKRTIEHLYTTKSVHRITPITPYTLPTICLMRHLSTKKPVTLVYESDYNKTHNHSPTHLILQHGQDVYLHVLHLNKVFQPYVSISQSEENNLKYRVNEFVDVINNHLVRINVKRDTEKDSSRTEDPEHSLMKHNNFIYNTPSSIERSTRFFPLTADETSILTFENAKEVYPTLFSKIITPLMNSVLRKSPENFTELDKNDLEKMLTKFYEHCKMNDESLFPELKNDHTKRWNSYRKAWGELRMFLLSLGFKESGLAVMDRLWPQFFFDKAQGDSDNTGRRAKRVVEVQRDRYGNIVFPIPLGALTVLALGKVVYDRPTFHTDKYIWPVGYKSTRYYTSVKDTNKRCLYTCEIKDGGEAPIFVLTSDDNPNEVIEAPSATAAWTAIVKQINKIKSEESGKRVFTNVSGPEYFGLAHPTIMKLISQLPNAEKINRPNAPHQPVKAESSTNELQESSDDEFSSAAAVSTPTPNAAGSTGSHTPTPTLQPSQSQASIATSVSAVTAGGGGTPQLSDGGTSAQDASHSPNHGTTGPDLSKKRAKRNEAVFYERDTVRNEIQKVPWTPTMNLQQFCEQRNQKLVGKVLDGENEGEKALYAHLNLNTSDRSRDQPSSSSAGNHHYNQYGNAQGQYHGGGNRQRKYGQKRKFGLYQ
ncbi:hypothetical protein C9374_010805 [Naegleria lovaniensis]|uniref:Uncharacterized protein n=1 Tax=Naegleria lovaniensis TaxID=51637 RepID=A0AA88GI21_NAELO|nr:uncharacterized protein C9374_010805 [Naegleria lovaniensis]KAG2374521.1 hypothetical protein C9374_010805 [Naegleria lovaniensis]